MLRMTKSACGTIRVTVQFRHGPFYPFPLPLESHSLKFSEQRKQNREVPVKTKEVQLTPGISEHDLSTKIKQISKFLDKKHLVNLKVKFAGRENHHKELGEEVMEKIIGTFDCRVLVEPKHNGRDLLARIGPK